MKDKLQAMPQPIPSVEILRHKAAIRRTELSLPLKCLLRDNLLTEDSTFFDYGCGYGDDLKRVRQLGNTANGWDPAHRPDESVCEADIVNLGYVINVIEDQIERRETLRAAWHLARRVFSVAARIAVDGTGDGDFEFGDGVVTRIQTFQKYYTQAELRQYLEQTLNAEAIPAAPGVFYLFKDPALRESFSASKYRRCSCVPRKLASEVEFDRHRELLEDLIRVSANLARLPFADEFDRTEEVITKLGSLKQAFKLIRKVTGADPWDTIRQSRIDDLRVYLALARFPKRPTFAQMPQAMQRDIKEFFGGYKNACDSADALLFESGRSELIDAACQRSTIGRLTSNALYLHRSTIASLEPVLRVFEGCAKTYLGDVDDANIVKLHRFSGKVSYLACPRFESHPHPPIERTIKLSLRNLFLQCIDHANSKNPLLLDQKERMVENDHPWFDRFARFSGQESQHGLLDDLDDLLPAAKWQSRMNESGLMIRGYRLLYQEGVKRKRLPPRSPRALPNIGQEPGTQLLPDVGGVDESLHDRAPIASIDFDREDEVSDNRSAELPTRSRRYGVGKEIGYAVYLHREYEDRLGVTVEWAKRHLPEHYDYTVVKLNQRNDSVSFIRCPHFDSEHEPAIDAIIVVSANGTAQRRNTPADQYIYHHKWLFVDDDYRGFDVEESKVRSKHWTSLIGVDRARIGRHSYWEQNVVPRLNGARSADDRPNNTDFASEPPTPSSHWVRSEEARKLLKLTTCELAHLREQGKIDFRKAGTAFEYLISKKNEDRS